MSFTEQQRNQSSTTSNDAATTIPSVSFKSRRVKLFTMYPFMSETYKVIRKYIAGMNNDLKHSDLIEALNKYKVGCINNYDEILDSLEMTVKFSENIIRTIELFKNTEDLAQNSEEIQHRICELMAIFITCQLRVSYDFEEETSLIANRIIYIMRRYLILDDYDEQQKHYNILRTLVFIPKLFNAREIMCAIYEEFIKSKELQEKPNVMPDKLYILYVINFYRWMKMQNDAEGEKRIIDFAERFMKPEVSLFSNKLYAIHLPRCSTQSSATRIILNNMKFYRDIRNAALIDNSFKKLGSIVNLCDDDDVIALDTSTEVDFAKIFNKVLTEEPLSDIFQQIKLNCIDPMSSKDAKISTAQDDTTAKLHKIHNEWLARFYRNAKHSMESKAINEQRRKTDEADNEDINIICLDSDSETEAQETFQSKHKITKNSIRAENKIKKSDCVGAKNAKTAAAAVHHSTNRGDEDLFSDNYPITHTPITEEEEYTHLNISDAEDAEDTTKLSNRFLPASLRTYGSKKPQKLMATNRAASTAKTNNVINNLKHTQQNTSPIKSTKVHIPCRRNSISILRNPTQQQQSEADDYYDEAAEEALLYSDDDNVDHDEHKRGLNKSSSFMLRRKSQEQTAVEYSSSHNNRKIFFSPTKQLLLPCNKSSCCSNNNKDPRIVKQKKRVHFSDEPMGPTTSIFSPRRLPPPTKSSLLQRKYKVSQVPESFHHSPTMDREDSNASDASSTSSNSSGISTTSSSHKNKQYKEHLAKSSSVFRDVFVIGRPIQQRRASYHYTPNTNHHLSSSYLTATPAPRSSSSSPFLSQAEAIRQQTEALKNVAAIRQRRNTICDRTDFIRQAQRQQQQHQQRHSMAFWESLNAANKSVSPAQQQTAAKKRVLSDDDAANKECKIKVRRASTTCRTTGIFEHDTVSDTDLIKTNRGENDEKLAKTCKVIIEPTSELIEYQKMQKRKRDRMYNQILQEQRKRLEQRAKEKLQEKERMKRSEQRNQQLNDEQQQDCFLVPKNVAAAATADKRENTEVAIQHQQRQLNDATNSLITQIDAHLDEVPSSTCSPSTSQRSPLHSDNSNPTAIYDQPKRNHQHNSPTENSTSASATHHYYNQQSTTLSTSSHVNNSLPAAISVDANIAEQLIMQSIGNFFEHDKDVRTVASSNEENNIHISSVSSALKPNFPLSATETNIQNSSLSTSTSEVLNEFLANSMVSLKSVNDTDLLNESMTSAVVEAAGIDAMPIIISNVQSLNKNVPTLEKKTSELDNHNGCCSSSSTASSKSNGMNFENISTTIESTNTTDLIPHAKTNKSSHIQTNNNISATHISVTHPVAAFATTATMPGETTEFTISILHPLDMPIISDIDDLNIAHNYSHTSASVKDSSARNDGCTDAETDSKVTQFLDHILNKTITDSEFKTRDEILMELKALTEDINGNSNEAAAAPAQPQHGTNENFPISAFEDGEKQNKRQQATTKQQRNGNDGNDSDVQHTEYETEVDTDTEVQMVRGYSDIENDDPHSKASYLMHKSRSKSPSIASSHKCRVLLKRYLPPEEQAKSENGDNDYTAETAVELQQQEEEVEQNNESEVADDVMKTEPHNDDELNEDIKDCKTKHSPDANSDSKNKKRKKIMKSVTLNLSNLNIASKEIKTKGQRKQYAKTTLSRSRRLQGNSIRAAETLQLFVNTINDTKQQTADMNSKRHSSSPKQLIDETTNDGGATCDEDQYEDETGENCSSKAFKRADHHKTNFFQTKNSSPSLDQPMSHYAVNGLDEYVLPAVSGNVGSIRRLVRKPQISMKSSKPTAADDNSNAAAQDNLNEQQQQSFHNEYMSVETPSDVIPLQLFNDKSQDSIKDTAPAPNRLNIVDSSSLHSPARMMQVEEQEHSSSANDKNYAQPVLSPSEQEVSSTQESQSLDSAELNVQDFLKSDKITEIKQTKINNIFTAASSPKSDTVRSVQNSQIDTTNHSPEIVVAAQNDTKTNDDAKKLEQVAHHQKSKKRKHVSSAAEQTNDAKLIEAARKKSKKLKKALKEEAVAVAAASKNADSKKTKSEENLCSTENSTTTEAKQLPTNPLKITIDKSRLLRDVLHSKEQSSAAVDISSAKSKNDHKSKRTRVIAASEHSLAPPTDAQTKDSKKENLNNLENKKENSSKAQQELTVAALNSNSSSAVSAAKKIKTTSNSAAATAEVTAAKKMTVAAKKLTTNENSAATNVPPTMNSNSAVVVAAAAEPTNINPAATASAKTAKKMKLLQLEDVKRNIIHELDGANVKIVLSNGTELIKKHSKVEKSAEKLKDKKPKLKTNKKENSNKDENKTNETKNSKDKQKKLQEEHQQAKTTENLLKRETRTCNSPSKAMEENKLMSTAADESQYAHLASSSDQSAAKNDSKTIKNTTVDSCNKPPPLIQNGNVKSLKDKQLKKNEKPTNNANKIKKTLENNTQEIESQKVLQNAPKTCSSPASSLLLSPSMHLNNRTVFTRSSSRSPLPLVSLTAATTATSPQSSSASVLSNASKSTTTASEKTIITTCPSSPSASMKNEALKKKKKPK